MTMGKWIAGGLPVGMYGMTRGVADAVSSYGGRGMGTTLAGGAFSTHVMKRMLRDVITEESYSVMKAAARRYADAVSGTIERLDLPWHVTSLGARVAFGFDETPPRSGTSFLTDGQVEARSLVHRTLWFFLANRGVTVRWVRLHLALLSPARGQGCHPPYRGDRGSDCADCGLKTRCACPASDVTVKAAPP